MTGSQSESCVHACLSHKYILLYPLCQNVLREHSMKIYNSDLLCCQLTSCCMTAVACSNDQLAVHNIYAKLHGWDVLHPMTDSPKGNYLGLYIPDLYEIQPCMYDLYEKQEKHMIL